MTKPFGRDINVPTIKPPVDNTATPKTPQGNPIGQNVDGSYIYEQTKPTTPATTFFVCFGFLWQNIISMITTEISKQRLS